LTKKLKCPKEFSDVNEENTPCSNCGSRIHYTLFDGFIRCSYCDSVIDDSSSMIEPEIIKVVEDPQVQESLQ
jgi:ribosomal protein L37AE/L43A